MPIICPYCSREFKGDKLNVPSSFQVQSRVIPQGETLSLRA